MENLSEELQAFCNSNVNDNLDRVITDNSALTKFIEMSIGNTDPMNWGNPYMHQNTARQAMIKASKEIFTIKGEDEKAEELYFRENLASGKSPLFGFDTISKEQQISAISIWDVKSHPIGPDKKRVKIYLDRSNESKNYFHKEIMDTCQYYGAHMAKENIPSTDWDKECEDLKEYLSWCIDKRLLNRLHPALTSGPLPDFRSWKTHKIIDKIRSTTLTFLTLPMFEKINIYNPISHGKIVDEHGKQIWPPK